MSQETAASSKQEQSSTSQESAKTINSSDVRKDRPWDNKKMCLAEWGKTHFSLSMIRLCDRKRLSCVTDSCGSTFYLLQLCLTSRYLKIIISVRHRPVEDHVIGCVCVSVCICLQQISQTTGPLSLIFCVHIYDCMLKNLSWLQWFIIVEKAVLFTVWYDHRLPTPHSSQPASRGKSAQIKRTSLTACWRPHFGLRHGS